jgi:mRNA interferase RelE/StbE
MTYTVSILRRAQKQLEDIQGDDFDRVTDAIAALATNPRPSGCIKLTGRDGWRIRSGDFRVIYEINDGQLLVTVVQIGNRRDVYRR